MKYKVQVQLEEEAPHVAMPQLIEAAKEELDAFELSLKADGERQSPPENVQSLNNYERWLISRYLIFRYKTPSE